MEEMMMVMMMNTRSHESSPNNTHHPTWKLYENPFYISHHKPQQPNHPLIDQQHDCDLGTTQIHRLHLPVSARKIAASFWDLTFIMESELDTGRARINSLKAELECECKARKKMESLNKRLARELSEERKGRQALEKVCEELAGEILANKAEINRMKKEMDEERKMLRTAEVIREERVQMKLAEAKMFLEEKLSELELCPKTETGSSSSLSNSKKASHHHQDSNAVHRTTFGEKLRFVNSMAMVRRRASPEAENPHIKRGIKGFVEFPKVVRAIGCRSSKSKLECQKAQLKILLKQKGSVRFNGLIAS